MICQGCEKRHMRCHEECEDYLAEYNKRREEAEQRRRDSIATACLCEKHTWLKERWVRNNK